MTPSSPLKPSPSAKWLLAIITAGSCAAALGATASLPPLEANCSFEHGSGAGPFDYRNQRAMLGVVEKRHFTSDVERLIRGESTSRPGPDISYTLNKFPNHHRALASLSQLGQRMKADKVPEMEHSVLCYFDRAVRFRPDDTVARLLFVRHLGAIGRTPDGRRHLALTAEYVRDDNPLTHYNIGLVAVELQDYERALVHAHRAYALGATQPGLRNQLVKAGKWAEPAGPPASAAAGPASGAAVSGPR